MAKPCAYNGAAFVLQEEETGSGPKPRTYEGPCICPTIRGSQERPQTARVQQQAPLEVLQLYYRKRKRPNRARRVGGRARAVWAGGEHEKQEPHTVMWGKSHSTAMSDAHPPPKPPAPHSSHSTAMSLPRPLPQHQKDNSFHTMSGAPPPPRPPALLSAPNPFIPPQGLTRAPFPNGDHTTLSAKNKSFHCNV